jgi:hypothetical protein
MKKIIGFVLTIVLVSFFCNSSFCQENKFNFGIEAHLNFSQIEGDKLRGFNKVSPGIGLLGGYSFNNKNQLIFNPHFDIIGSNRSSEKLSSVRNDFIGEAHVSRIALLFGYAHDFGDSWTGESMFRVYVGIKYSRIIKGEVDLVSNMFGGLENVEEPTFKSSFNSLVLGFGRKLSHHTSIDLSYEHGFSSLLKDNNLFSRFIPFGLSLRLNYTI